MAEKVETLFHFYLLGCGFLLIHFLFIFLFACVFFKGDPSFVDEIRRNGE